MKTACISFCLLFAFPIFSQKNTASPYSRYGIGLMRSAALNGNIGLGGSGYAWRPSNYRPEIYDSLARSGATINDRNTNYINISNPASFSNYSLTTYEAGFYSQTTDLENNNQTQRSTSSTFSHLAIAFPIGNRWGMGFGIKPLSEIGYDYQRASSLNGTSQLLVFDGSGGLNEAFLGTGVQLNSNWAVGVNAKFIFGKKSEIKRVVYGSNDFFNTLDQSNLVYNDFNFDIGVQYFKNLDKDHRFIAGLTVSPISEVRAKQSRLIRSYKGNEGFEAIKDTIYFKDEENVTVDMGSSYGTGIAYEKKGKWIMMMDYTFVDRKNVFLESAVKATDNHRLSVGYENFTSQSAFGNYLKQMGYRLGAHYNSSLIEIDGENISEIGMSFGLVLPLRKSFSTLNLSVEVGERGTTSKNLVKEQFLNIHLGVTINDKWFVKRKYD